MLRSSLARLRPTPQILRCGGAVGIALAGGYGYSAYALCETRPVGNQPALMATKVKPAPQPLLATSPAEKPMASGPSMLKRCFAEAIGTAIIVAGGCGVVCAAKYANSGAKPFGLAATWGLSVALAVYVTRSTSGAHLNPAVTCALVANGKFSAEEGGAYALSQCVGATLAGAANYFFFSSGIAALEASSGIVRGTAASVATFNGAFGMAPTVALLGAGGAFIAEVYMTAVLVFLISAVTDVDAGSVPDAAAPALIGSAVAVMIGTFGPVTGAGMNPARDLGPRLVTLCTGWGAAATTAWWAYTLGPCIGACIGMATYDMLFGPLARKGEGVKI
jgi:glycerol uptake facilitator protein